MDIFSIFSSLEHVTEHIDQNMNPKEREDKTHSHITGLNPILNF